MNILKEISVAMKLTMNTPEIKCTFFEDNNGALELAQTLNICPRTKHVAVKYHFFRDFIKRGLIKVMGIATEEEEADYLTKPVPGPAFKYLRKKSIG